MHYFAPRTSYYLALVTRTPLASIVAYDISCITDRYNENDGLVPSTSILPMKQSLRMAFSFYPCLLVIWYFYTIRPALRISDFQMCSYDFFVDYQRLSGGQIYRHLVDEFKNFGCLKKTAYGPFSILLALISTFVTLIPIYMCIYMG